MLIGVFVLITTIVSIVTFQLRRASAHSQEPSCDSPMHEVMKSEDVQGKPCEDNSWFDRSASSPCGAGNTIRDQEPKSSLDAERR